MIDMGIGGNPRSDVSERRYKLLTVPIVKMKGAVRMGNIVETEAKYKNHYFIIGVDEESGKINVAIDGGEPIQAKGLQNGNLVFYSERELVVKDKLESVREVPIPEADFKLLRAAVERIMLDKAASQKAKKAAQTYRGQITRWRKKVRSRKMEDGSLDKYVIHDMTIGADRYSFSEHIVPGAEETVVINPNYKLSEDTEGVGGRVARYGNLFVWQYWTEEKGWYTVRELTMNEKICVVIIYDYGYFSAKNIKSIKGKRKWPWQSWNRPHGEDGTRPN